MENQLKATELRLNNQVFFSDESEGVKNAIATIKGIEDDDMLKFTAINVKDNSTETRISISQNTIEGWGELSQFSGIPLTEDILVKLGFEIDSVDRPILHADYKVINPITHDYMIELKNVGTGWFYRNGYFKIDYVHQLQNLYFALCGEELTFKN